MHIRALIPILPLLAALAGPTAAHPLTFLKPRFFQAREVQQQIEVPVPSNDTEPCAVETVEVTVTVTSPSEPTASVVTDSSSVPSSSTGARNSDPDDCEEDEEEETHQHHYHHHGPDSENTEDCVEEVPEEDECEEEEEYPEDCEEDVQHGNGDSDSGNPEEENCEEEVQEVDPDCEDTPEAKPTPETSPAPKPEPESQPEPVEPEPECEEEDEEEPECEEELPEPSAPVPTTEAVQRVPVFNSDSEPQISVEPAHEPVTPTESSQPIPAPTLNPTPDSETSSELSETSAPETIEAPVSETNQVPVPETSEVSAPQTSEAPAPETPTETPAEIPEPASTPAASNPVSIGAGPSAPQPPSQSVGLLTSNPSAQDLDGTSETSVWITQFHNEWRAQFGAPPMTWSYEHASNANSNAATGVFQHFGGDNLAEFYSTDPNASWTANQLMETWTNEWESHYNPPSHTLDHFTAMIWKGATSFGCAWNTECGAPGQRRTYFVCKYGPVTNIVGEDYYAANVGDFVGGNL